jgi:hypothetical protein
MRRDDPSPRALARLAAVLAPVAMLTALTWPLLFTSSGFSGDWEHHLWMMWHESISMKTTIFPTFFINSSYSAFYPMFAFYGGTLYAFGAILSLAMGGAPVTAYVLVYLAGFVAAFAGWYWLGRMAGLGHWAACVPGLVFVTSAYYLLIIYAEGDWPAFTGTSMIPLMVAAALSVLRAERLRIPAFLALALSVTLFFGSHSLTIIMGLTTIAPMVLAALICVPEARRQLTRRGIVRLLAVMVPAGLVSAWYLLPLFAYVSHTHSGQDDYGNAHQLLVETAWLVAFRNLFSFSRSELLPGALPVLAIVWVLAGMVLLPWRSRDRAWTALLLIFSAVAVVIGVAMTHVGILLALPAPFTNIEFSYRLEICVLLAISASVLAALALERRGARRTRAWTWLAVPICAVSLAGATQQVAEYPDRAPDRYAALRSFGEVETGRDADYQDASQPVIPTEGLPTLEFPPGAVRGNEVSASSDLPAGTLVLTNIAAGPYLVHLSGARPVGIDDGYGYMVLSIGDSGRRRAPGSAQTITVSPASGLPIVLGRLLTFAALATLALELAVLVRRALRGRRAG